MDEEKSYEWLEGQNITIPVEAFINLRLELAKAVQDRTDAIHEKWEIRDTLDDLQKAYDKLKKDYQKVLGVEEGDDGK